MNILIGFLTVALVLTCLLLGLLILIQLPKKEAGMGAAFGGGTTDALFGAGSGTALTQITKYAAGTFLTLSLVLSVLHANQANKSGKRLQEELERKAKTGTAAVAPAAPATSTNVMAAVSSAAVAATSNGATKLLMTTSNAASSTAKPAAAPVTPAK